jgi:hypothetical protein
MLRRASSGSDKEKAGGGLWGIRLGSQRSRDAASVASFKPSQAVPVNHLERENHRLYSRSVTRHGLS